MADLIDRQTAIETAIEAADKWDGGYSSEREGIIRKFFDKVPAVQSDHNADISKKAEGDCISRQAVLYAIVNNPSEEIRQQWIGRNSQEAYLTGGAHRQLEIIDLIDKLPTAQPEPLTDKEQRIFLAAMGREEKVCKQVDDEYRSCREPYEDSLVRTCREIIRKVKGTLWT